MSIVIQTNNLSRVFQTYEKPEGLLNSIKGIWQRKYKEKLALAPTSIEIDSGKIIGLVGANGAGKTTFLKLLSGLIYPSSGEALVLGHRPWERTNAFLRRISILLGQKNQLWWDIPASDSFNLLARIYELDLLTAKKRVQELAEILDCSHVLNTQLRRLSLGERMKMEIIGSLLHSPDILFLDEPTIGLDVVAQTSIRNFLMNYVQEFGPTVILTSHYMDDIAMLADRLLLISHGEFVYDGSVSDFSKASESLQTLKITTSEPLTTSIIFSEGNTLNSGEQCFSLQLHAKDIPSAIQKIAAKSTIKELKIEEVDFEEIIRKFLEKESRLLSAGNRKQSGISL